MGPDEYHDGYPGAASPGLDNNAYTNIMTVWLLLRARQALALIPRRVREDLRRRLGLTDAETERWEEITRRMRVDFHDGVISQFTGYERLAELDWDRYRGIRRLDRALEAENDSPNRYRASKQADVLMLFYLLTSREVRQILDRLGYPAPPDLTLRTIRYYLSRTSHGSTLSAVAHARVLARSDRIGSWRFFTETLTGDIIDVQEDHRRGRPPGRHGRHAGPGPALLPRPRSTGRRPAPESGAPRTVDHAVVVPALSRRGTHHRGRPHLRTDHPGR